MTTSEKLSAAMTRLNELRSTREALIKQMPLFDSKAQLEYVGRVERQIRQCENYTIELRSKLADERLSEVVMGMGGVE